jgi:hypothetical protein
VAGLADRALLETCEAMVAAVASRPGPRPVAHLEGKALFLPDELSLHRAGSAPVDTRSPACSRTTTRS